jgi:hypothetical protein
VRVIKHRLRLCNTVLCAFLLQERLLVRGSMLRYPYRRGVPRNFVRVGKRGSTNLVEGTGQTERGSGGGSPLIRGSTQFAKSDTRILIRLLRMYFPRNWEFGLALSKLRNFRAEGKGVV